MFTGYKTYIASALVAVFGVLATTDWISFLSNPAAGITAIATAILFAVLRSITTTPGGIQMTFNPPGTITEKKKD